MEKDSLGSNWYG